MKLLKYMLFFLPLFMMAQNESNEILVPKNGSLYFDLLKEEPILRKDPDHMNVTYKLKKDQTIRIKRSSMEFNFTWINPLKYTLVINDSIVDDVEVEAVIEFGETFGSILATGTGISLEEIAKFQNEEGLAMIQKGGIARLREEAIAAEQLCSLPEFKELEYLSIGTDYRVITRLSDQKVCDVLKGLYVLEEEKLHEHKRSIIDQTNKMFVVTEYSDVQSTITESALLYKKHKDGYLQGMVKLVDFQNKINALDNPLDIWLKLKLAVIHKKLSEELKWIHVKLPVYKSYIDTFKKSIEGEDPLVHTPLHFWKKTIELPSRKGVDVKLTLTENEFSTTSYEIKSKESSKEYSIKLRRYDFIKPSLGTGLFYANTKIAGFGVSTNDDGELIVSEDDIDADKVVTGLFLNLNFDLNSQYFSPLIQLGVDPTKERPFLLLGVGFSIPVSKISITGGPIWTWTPELNKLAVDEVVSSTSTLEDDISYKFETEPKGFYLGLNYSF